MGKRSIGIGLEQVKKKAVVVVPHQDDEILTGGAALVELIRNQDWEVHVVYVTNGDSRGSWEAEIRLRDACKVLGFLGLDQSCIHFLGYANRWQGNKHIYNAPEGEILRSCSGKTETYGTYMIPDFSYEREKEHHKYTRENLKHDLKNVLQEVLPDLYIVTDLDKHEDHRATSLLFEECMGEMLKELPGYKPFILKKFAYIGVWKGEKDYWKIPHRATWVQQDLPNPFFEWSERICFSVPEDCNTPLLHQNTLFKASKLYRTQYVWTRAAGYLNDDICYWQRHSNNAALHAEVRVSSGRGELLNDFKIIDSDDIRDSIQWNYQKGVWSPNETDSRKEITILFDHPVTVRNLVVYECSMENSGIKKMKLFFDERVENEISIVERKKNIIYFEDYDAVKVKEIKFIITESYGRNLGISEIEVLDKVMRAEDYKLPFKQYAESYKKKKISIGVKILMGLEKRYLNVAEYFWRNLWLPKWELCNEYPILLEKTHLYLPLQVQRMCKKILKKIF